MFKPGLVSAIIPMAKWECLKPFVDEYCWEKGFRREDAILIPFDFEHQCNMDDWLMLEKIEDVVLESCKPCDFDYSRF